MAYDDEKQSAASSPVDKAPYFPDDKILSVAETIPNPDHAIPRSTTLQPDPAQYVHGDLPPRPRRPFWKRRIVWLLVVLILTIIIAVVVGVVVAHKHSKPAKSEPEPSKPQQNSTLASVASSGLFLRDGTTWNMQVYSQNATGDLQYRMSLDGDTYEAQHNVSLSIAARIGSPLSATSSTDSTGVVFLSLFYLAASNEIAVCQMACAAGSSTCATTSNSVLKTGTPPNPYTGLAAINVNDAQDWRVYYHDNSGLINELLGNSSGFATGTPIGGRGLNASSIAAVNVNSTTNNINVFYVDQLTKSLFTLQFTDAWSIPAPLSPERVFQWNPLSGLGAAYSVGQDQLHVYYTGLDTLVYEFLGSKSSTTETVWAAQPGQNHIWGEADVAGADITAVGWEDQVRFYQMVQGRLAEGVLSNLTWTEEFI